MDARILALMCVFLRPFPRSKDFWFVVEITGQAVIGLK